MTGYRPIEQTPFPAQQDGRAVVLAPSTRKTLGFFGNDLGSGRPTEGRVPAFLGLAERTGGVYVENPPSVEEALRQTGLDFTVRLDPLSAARTETILGETGLEDRPTGEQLPMPGWMATVAYPNDGGTPFAIAPTSERYAIFQNDEALAVGDALSEGRLVALGAYGRPVGARVYGAWELGEGMDVAGDPYRNFVTVVTTHDRNGTYGLLAPIRLGCTNQTNATFGRKATPRFSIRHVGEPRFKLEEARRILGLSRQYLDTFKEGMESLLTIKMTKDDFLSYGRKVWGTAEDDEDLSKRSLTLARTRDEDLLRILAGQTCAFGEGTAYAGYQAVTEYLDWYGTVRGGTDAATRRQERIMLGELDGAKTKAFDLAVSYA